MPTESREARVIRGLLALLGAEGLTSERQSLEAEFESRNWSGLSQEDVDRVYAVLQRVETKVEPAGNIASFLKQAADSHAPPIAGTKHAASAETPSAAIADFTPFIESVPGGFALAAALEELAAARTLDESREALNRVFVKGLGYARDDLDETERYQSETLRHVRIIARDAGFDVTLVALDYPYPYPKILDPVFKNHPYGIVVVIAPRWNTCRFVFRHLQGARAGELWTRTFVGRRPAPEPLDNLAIWTRRLEMLRPVYGEARGEKQLRAQRALATSAAAIGEDWSSAALRREQEPPGIGWGTLMSRRLEAFLQPGAALDARRSFTGLERALRSYFPTPVVHGAAWLRYESYTVEKEEEGPEQAFAEGRTWGWRVVLHFSLTKNLSQPGRRIDIPAIVPAATANGRFVLVGSWYRFSPRLGIGSQMEKMPILSGWNEADEDGFELLMAPLEGGAEPSMEEEPPGPAGEAEVRQPQPEEEEEASIVFSGMDPCALLELATFRKLSAVRYHLWNASGPGFSLQNGPERENLTDQDLVGAVLWSFRTSWGRESRFLVVSKKYLAAMLDRAPDTSSPHERLMVAREPEGRPAATPPAWACPDVSADLPVGYWYPVAAARLSPAGRLTVPCLKDGALVLSSPGDAAWEINPRLGGCGVGPHRWWISEALAPFAEMKPGSLQAAAHIAGFARPFPSMPVFSMRSAGARKSVLRLGLEQQRRLPGEERTHLAVDIPCLDANERCPSLNVQAGQPVRPGEVWLTAPARTWLRASLAAEAAEPPRKLPPLVRFAREGFPELSLTVDAADELVRWRIPPGIRGKVVEARISEITDRSGGLRMAWRAFLLVTRETGAEGGHVILPDGRAMPVLPIGPQDAPFNDHGELTGAFIEEPWQGPEAPVRVGSWRDGGTGESTEVSPWEQAPLLYLPPSGSTLVEGPDAWLRARARDGEGIPAHARAPALPAWQRLWWAARAPADDFTAAERAWAGGAPPFLRHLDEVLEAAMIEPEAAEAAPEEPRDIDQLPKVLREGEMGYQGDFDPGRSWHCECADEDSRIEGSRRAYDRCQTCLALVTLHPRKRRRLPVFSLPEQVLHPWRTELAAALLGISVDELLSRHASQGGAALAAALLESSQEASSTLAGQRPSESRRKRGVRQAWLTLLRDKNPGPTWVARLLTSELPVLPPILHPTSFRSMNSHAAHLPPLASSHVSSPLTARYLRVRHQAIRLEQVLKSNSQILIEVARRELQRAVSDLFGPVDAGRSGAEPAHLAALLCRIWPLTRPASLRSVPPDLVRCWARPARVEARSVTVERLAPEDKSLHPSAEFEREEFDQGAKPVQEIEFFGIERMRIPLEPESPGREQLAVVGRARLRWMPPLPRRSPEPSRPEFWRERFALDVFLKELLPYFVVIVAGRLPHETGDANTRNETQAHLSQLLAALSDPEAAPAELVQLLQGKLPMHLSRDEHEARRSVAGVLQRAFPGSSPGLVAARERLMLVFSSFWHVPDSPEYPLGWAWLGQTASGPAQGRRMVPPLQSVAWALLPDFDAVAAPARFFLANGRRLELLPAAMRACLGLDTAAALQSEEPRDALPPTPPEEVPGQPLPSPRLDPVLSPPVAMELPTQAPARADASEIQLLTTDWKVWLKATGANRPEKGSTR